MKVKQKERILQYIKDFGSITHGESVSELGILGFTARMTELRQDGYHFRQEMERSRNRYGEPVHYYRYYLEG